MYKDISDSVTNDVEKILAYCDPVKKKEGAGVRNSHSYRYAPMMQPINTQINSRVVDSVVYV